MGSSRSAFTLIELLLVLVILGVLAALVVPKFTGRAEDARKQAARTDVATLKGAVDTFEIDNGRLPTNEEGLNALITQPANVSNWHQGGYLDTSSLPKDPWGNQYIYRYPGQHNAGGYDIYSTGPDGREGGGDDIGNWTE